MAPLWAIALLGLVSTLVYADGIYSKNSPVLQVTAKNYGSLIAQSNHTSILEFYAPWCGHCQNLKPAYEKAAKNLAGLAKVAAINCDDEENKPLCGSMGVQGFPTLKIIKPGKKPGKPVVEDYQGPRETKSIVDAVVDKIPNHVKRLQDAGLEDWLIDTTTKAKAILFTEKGTTSALIKSLAVDFLGSISVAQVRSKEQAAVDKYGITQFPSIVLLPGEGQDPVIYTNEMKKQPLVDFFSQVTAPNPDPAPKKAKASTSAKAPKDAKKSSSASASFSEASEAHKASDFEDFASATTIVLDENTPTESPLPIVENQEKPMVVPAVVPPIKMLATPSELEEKCIARKSGTCILVLLPVGTGAETDLAKIASEALSTFAEIAEKHHKRKDHTFPFYAIPADNERAKVIRGELGLKADTDLEILALNNKRGWWRHYPSNTYDGVSLESFVDAIKLGEGSKQKLPAGFDGQQVESTETPAEPTPAAEPEVEANTAADTTTSDAQPEPEATPEPTHDEL